MKCLLCKNATAIKNSHCIPKFVTRYLKSNSTLPGMRNAAAPNRAVQDVPTYELVCVDCENRFSGWEKSVSEVVFRPFQQTSQTQFAYGSWLHKFAASLSWRTIAIRLQERQFDKETENVLIRFQKRLQNYLLYEDTPNDRINQYLVLWDKQSIAQRDMSRFDINFVVRNQAVHDIFSVLRYGWCATLHNHAGCVFVTVINAKDDDDWGEHGISPTTGEFQNTGLVSSWIIDHWKRATVLTHQKMRERLSEKQRSLISDLVRKDPNKTEAFIKRDPNVTILD